ECLARVAESRRSAIVRSTTVKATPMTRASTPPATSVRRISPPLSQNLIGVRFPRRSSGSSAPVEKVSDGTRRQVRLGDEAHRRAGGDQFGKVLLGVDGDQDQTGRW